MFSFKNKKRKIPEVSVSKKRESIDPRSIPTHTMQDDLDALDGKIIPEKREHFIFDEKEENQAQVSRFQRPDVARNSPPADESPFLTEGSAPVESLAGFVKDEKRESLPVQKPYGPPAEKSPAKSKFLIIIIFILIILAAASGGYYFWLTRQEADVPAPEPVIPENITLPVEKPQVEIVQEKFSENLPNYLVLDVEKMNQDEIKQVLINKGLEVKDASVSFPVEFVIADSNNNPVSFSAFNIISGQKLPNTILENLEDEFSVYFYKDGNNLRSGLAVKVKDKSKLAAELKKEEPNLVKDLSIIYLDNKPVSELKSFGDGAYKTYAIRYLNLNPENTLSFDYSITDKYLVIGTSKAIMRAILDKLEK